ncbi:protein phosphatase 2C domain-containing protein [Methanomicrobium antiquum]|uniref:Protein phosphatase 2C domain-containing protein n=1 Tax=Methanomicrobium antiquum TaxID=487686 RepID=A0AAF0JTX0_9EURY|nr:protein phosphatase 2C domain-containing protein [Methanomicrobium antiquum]WFN36883.1 protein phosphatase 2C domain-containing protein [Methanomicrobium antiquum]
MDYSAVSVAGKRVYNEDSYIAAQIGKGYLLAVADGLGGHAAGDVASNIAVSTIRRIFSERYFEGMDADEKKELLIFAFKEADLEIIKNATGNQKGMGTTLVAAFVENDCVIAANTGDSRLYHYDFGLKQITIDHSVVQDLVSKGLVEKSAARFHPMKHIINHSLGGDFTVDTFCFNIKEGDVLLLSSDGLHDYIDCGDIEKLLQKKSANTIAKELIKSAMLTSDDNITAVVMMI